MVIAHVFKTLNVDEITWIDIGAGHPFRYNNTTYFYENGGHGINIEPNPEKAELLKKHRPKDITINAGINAQPGTKKYHNLSGSELNTFKPEKANAANRLGFELLEVMDVEMITIDSALQSHITQHETCGDPEFLSIDTEGMDLEILKSIDFDKFYPKIICVESSSYEGKNIYGRKNYNAVTYLKKHGYKVLADLPINTIMVSSNVYKQITKNDSTVNVIDGLNQPP